MAGRDVRLAPGGAIVWVAAAIVIVAQPPSAVADPAADYEKLVKEKAAAYVTVKYVLKMEGALDDSADEAETAGIMIDPRGLVLCGSAAIVGGYFGRSSGSRPTDIKVLVGEDTEGLPATLLARDRELGLAWIQLKESPKQDFVYIDFAKAAVPKLGQRLLGLHKMGKYFDRAVVVSEGRMTGRTKKPRELFVAGGGLHDGPALPAFTEKGTAVGVFVVQLPDASESTEAFFSFLSDAEGGFGGLILPAAEVVKATKQARETKGEAGSKEDAKEEPKRSATDKGKTPVDRENAETEASGEGTKAAAGAKPTSRPAAPRD